MGITDLAADVAGPLTQSTKLAGAGRIVKGFRGSYRSGFAGSIAGCSAGCARRTQCGSSQHGDVTVARSLRRGERIDGVDGGGDTRRWSARIVAKASAKIPKPCVSSPVIG